MRRAPGLSLTLLLLATSCTGHGPVKVTTADAGHTIELYQGEDLQVSLDSNRSTGFRWTFVNSSPAIVIPMGEPDYVQQMTSSGQVGAGGTEIWRLRATDIGRQSIRFEYRRPWEPSAPPARVVKFNVAVE